MTQQRIVIVGAGGFARELRWLIREINGTRSVFEFAGYVVSDLAKLGELDSRDDVVGDYRWLEENRGRIDALAIGIGTPASRLKVGTELSTLLPGMAWPALVHPTVRLDLPSASLGRGVILCAGTIGTVNVVLEDFAMVNLACTLGHECRLGRGVVLNPTVNISGGVRIDDGALVGTGAQVLQYVSIGEGAVVGAGAVVTRDVAPGTTVVGMPAKPLQR